ncbi:hypothetical protein MAM1_0386d10222 [Mucor ambiguus]|uniref:HSF-type DNA-binding domain-containing protein n=1 Tax=Mucor ambiguus TaxID=91626 RepID=A0A0C9N3N9_9FUNG|nr:hypothetical protein MAM1_0386d10222 [Mucor ambiguus]
MVDDDETKDLITWTGSGDQFTVFNNVDFSRNVLPRYFKHCNWSSFVRQLNMYDFHKINEQNDDDTFNVNNNGSNSSSLENDGMVQRWDFKHPWFTKTGYDRLHKIRRKPPRNRLIPQIRYSNAMELVDDVSEAVSAAAPSTSTPPPYTPSQSAVSSSSSVAPTPMKADNVQYLVSQLHDTTKNFESKLDYTCNEILYLRSVVDNQQMVLNELYNSVEYLKSRQLQKEADGGGFTSAGSSNHTDGEEARKPRKIHELLGINHEAQHLPQLQQQRAQQTQQHQAQQQQHQKQRARHESSRYPHPPPNHQEDNDTGYDDYDDRPHGRRKSRLHTEI